MIEIASTIQGRLSGKPADNCMVFFGIPYAAPPLGQLRWRPPHPAESWSGTRPADRIRYVAIQHLPLPRSLYYPGDLPQNEDCLTLNIWTAARSRSERRPVMVWFHFGAFAFGSSTATSPDGKLLFNGESLARSGAIVVTVNYRLGRLGFLAHRRLSDENDYGTSGNYGFLDQIAALRWVRNNIAEFGGDPECVTIFGVSAGSASCSLHMASPLSHGLFQRAIGGSGAFMAPPSRQSGLFDRLLILDAAEQQGERLAHAMGTDDIDVLRSRSPHEILNAPLPSDSGPWLIEAAGVHVGEGVSDTCYPIIDGYAIPDSPASIIRAGKHNDVPLITGSTYDDCSGLPGIETQELYEAYVRSDMGRLADRTLQAYPAMDSGTAFRASGDLLADRVFGWQNWTWANLARACGTRSVFYYDWMYAPPIPDGRYLERHRGAVHGAEIPYIFNNIGAYDWSWTEQDSTLADSVSRYWLNFAATGDPNGDGLPFWPRFEGHDGKSMHFSAHPIVDVPTRRDRFDVLNDY